MTQNKKHKQTLESVQYGLEISFKKHDVLGTAQATEVVQILFPMASLIFTVVKLLHDVI